MCIKCAVLKKVWWSKQKPRIYDRNELPQNTYHVLSYEAQSAWRALKMQTGKHIRKHTASEELE